MSGHSNNTEACVFDAVMIRSFTVLRKYDIRAFCYWCEGISEELSTGHQTSSSIKVIGADGAADWEGLY